MAAEKETLTDKAFRGMVFLTIGNVLNFVLKIGVLAILARIIMPESFGVVGLAIIIVEFCKVISELGFGPAMIRKSDLRPAHIGTSLWISFFLSVIITFLLFINSDNLAGFFKMELLSDTISILALLTIFNSISQISESILRKKLQFGYIAVFEFLAFAVGFGIIGLYAAFNDYGIYALIYAHLTSGLIKFILFAIFITGNLKYLPRWRAFTELFSFSGWFTWTNILNFTGQQSEKVIVGRFLGSEALGIYGRSQNIINIPLEFMSGMLGKILYPAFSLIQQDKEKMSLSFKRTYGITSLLTLPATIAIFLYAEDVILTVLGSNWELAITPLKIFSVVLFLRNLSRITQELIKSIGKEKERSFSQLIFVMIIIPGSLILYPYGINAIAGVVTFAYFINFLIILLLAIWYAGISLSETLKSISESFTASVLVIVSYALVSLIFNFIEDTLPIVRLISFGVTFSLLTLLLYFTKPKLLLGESGLWMKQYMISKYLKNKV